MSMCCRHERPALNYNFGIAFLFGRLLRAISLKWNFRNQAALLTHVYRECRHWQFANALSIWTQVLTNILADSSERNCSRLKGQQRSLLMCWLSLKVQLLRARAGGSSCYKNKISTIVNCYSITTKWLWYVGRNYNISTSKQTEV